MVGSLGYATSGSRRNRRGFSLIELVIVVVIIGIIAAIAVPRMSRGSQGAADSALSGNLSVLRNAIDLYQTEHQAYPGAGSTDPLVFERQLTKFTDAAGGSNGGGTKDATHPLGPYLRRIPPLPIGGVRKGSVSIRMAAAAEVPGASADGWIYYPDTGEIKANVPDSELDGKDSPYNKY
jgi:prepilin-type N-terminal cleavage/methylation domain-containing protein